MEVMQTNHPKMSDIKNDTGIKLKIFLKRRLQGFSAAEMIVNITHHHVVVHHQKIEDLHPIVHVIAVEIMNTNDQEAIENHHVIVRRNTNVIPESNIFYSLIFHIFLFLSLSLDDIIERKVAVIIEVMMNLLAVIVPLVVHPQRTSLRHRKLWVPLIVNFLRPILLKSYLKMPKQLTMIKHPIPSLLQAIQLFQHYHHLLHPVDRVVMTQNVHLLVTVIIRNPPNDHDVIVTMNVVIIDVRKINPVAVKNPPIQQNFLRM